jgi:peptidoglycan-associated lipoprotein
MKWSPVLVLSVLVLGLAACKSRQPQPDTTAPATDAGAQTSGLGTEATPEVEDIRALSAKRQQALAALQAHNVIYFEYDSSEIRGESLQIVADHAAYLAKYPEARVRLEGHTDERGSREYNIGLGERRGQTVRKSLMLQGVRDSQIVTVSYGEERPAAPGSNEAAYAKNRRVELMH